jgi:riboflavin synthase
MFTGIIEETGEYLGLQKGASSAVLTIRASKVLSGTAVGDSIAVNGVCLTVVRLFPDRFLADVMPETLRRSTLGDLKTGDQVNLERAMAADGRFGGHIVAGHVDGTGVIRSIRPESNAVLYTISADPKILRYIVEKGSVAIDGISLTVASLADDSFTVSVIPHTREITALAFRKAGDQVNLENDIIGKYVERLIMPGSSNTSDSGSGISMDFLVENGFL